jgi:prepilin-type processing-associated H-X9-DG protein/prepilin-type N-terminal cleavage/methylation domain-containing protein
MISRRRVRISSRPRRQYGLTLVEVVVGIALVGLLAVLILPAIQGAREAARRVACLGNLRQIGIALGGYASVHSCFPPGNSGGYSMHSMLLPQLEQNATFAALNFEVSPHGGGFATNATVYRQRIGVFVCPSDTPPHAADSYGWTSYPANRGFHSRRFDDNGFATLSRPLNHSQIKDGLGRTAALAEWRLGPLVRGQADPLGSIFSVSADLSGTSTLPAFLAACKRAPKSGSLVAANDKGLVWAIGDYWFSHYNHLLTPNRPSCLSSGFVQEGAYSASSRHPAGVHVSFADGHVEFVTESIAEGPWRALSTRHGGEVVAHEPR